MKTVSVIVPVYNNVSWMLQQCFDSVLRQTYPVQQLIIVDDGNTDTEMLETLYTYQTMYPDIIVLLQKEHGGISYARNIGFDSVEGDFVCFLDSDDFWNEDFIEKLMDAQQSNDADIVCCGYEEVSYKGDVVICKHPSASSFSDYKKYLYYTCFCTTRMYKVSFLRSIHCRFPQNCIMEDEAFSDFANTMAQKTVGIAYYGYNSRQRDDSTSRTRRNFNRNTKNEIPFEMFEKCLEFSCDAETVKQKILKYRLIHAMMASSWVFSCYTETNEKKEIVTAASQFMRKNFKNNLVFLLSHAHLRTGIKDYALCIFYVITLNFHLDMLGAAVFSFIIRMYYKINRIG